MAASSKFDLSSASPDRPAYPSGQRGAYTAASLDRLGSFREGMENRFLSALPSISRSGSTLSQGDMINLFHGLLFDMKLMAADQKFPKQGELKRAITAALGISPDESSSNSKLLSMSSVEELKRFKASLHDSSMRARDRVKTWNESISKLDKYFPSNLSRKRSRSDALLSDRSHASLPGDRSIPGGSAAKMGTQSHVISSGFELEPQKSEERTKNAVPNKRIRTSMVDMDVRANALARPSVAMDREREMFRLASSGAVQSEEKDRPLSIGVDGWEKSKMRKKRSGIKSDVSTSTALTRPLDGDRESKRSMQQRLSNDARSRLSNAHGFRSGPANGAAGVGKLDITSQQTGLGMRSTPRTDPDNGSILNDRRDRPVGSDKERVNLKAINKPSIRQDNSSSSPTLTAKMNSSARAPRSGSGAIPKSLPNVNRAIGVPDDWELSQSTNKLHVVVGANNRKRTPSTRSSSPPVAQWARRPQKISRVARRTNLVPLVSSHDEALVSDTVCNVPGNENGLGLPRGLSNNALQQVKSKSDHYSSAALSESEESGAAETKSKDKGKKSGEIDEKAGQNIQKVVLSSRKNKVHTDEDLGDGVRRQGRTGRGFASTRSGMSTPVEKLDNAVTAKQLRSARLGFDKIESKAGRPPTKKLSDRKAYTRPRHAVNSGAPDFNGELDNGHEELLAAANAAINSSHACSSLFWRHMDRFFGFVSAEDISYLKQQICLMDDSAVNLHITCNTYPDLKGDLGSSLLTPSTGPVCRDDCSTVPNGIVSIQCEGDMAFANEAKSVEGSAERLVPGLRVHDVIPFCQRLIAALISEEENDGFYCRGEDDHKFDIYGTKFELDAELKSSSLNERSLGNFQTNGRPALNGYSVTATQRYLNELEHDELGYDNVVEDANAGMISNFGYSLNGLRPDQAVISSIACSEFQYDHMSMDEKLLLEVQSIGIFPEPVPDLAQREDEEIGEDISRLEEKLHGQVLKKKTLLYKLEKSATEARELQEREIERRAFDRLVGMAYDKYMTCCGPNASCGKGASSKSAKAAALEFVKRTVERCQSFEDTGKSCFNEPVFMDMFLSVSSHFNDAECMDSITEGESANQYADTPTHSSERVSASLVSHHIPLISRSGKNINTHDKYSSDAFPSINHLSEQATGKEDIGSNRVKKRELLLDDVVGSSLRAASGIGSSLSSGAKGKRSERDREGKGHNREMLSRNVTAKTNVKGERKSKTKPKQKTTQLSVSVSGLLTKALEPPKAVLASVPKSFEMTTVSNAKRKNELGLDTMNGHEVLDFSNLQLPGMDVLGVPDDLCEQAQDLGSWLNIDDDGLQDHDFMGLEIPMDDLSDLNMMV